jgi:hypothetical protein
MTERYHHPTEETKKSCLDRLRESNRQLELYNLFLDDAFAKRLHQENRSNRFRITSAQTGKITTKSPTCKIN